jgi:hypothetical protein
MATAHDAACRNRVARRALGGTRRWRIVTGPNVRIRDDQRMSDGTAGLGLLPEHPSSIVRGSNANHGARLDVLTVTS